MRKLIFAGVMIISPVMGFGQDVKIDKSYGTTTPATTVSDNCGVDGCSLGGHERRVSRRENRRERRGHIFGRIFGGCRGGSCG